MNRPLNTLSSGTPDKSGAPDEEKTAAWERAEDAPVTKEQYAELANEALAATRIANDPMSREECARANKRIEDCERLMAAAPWGFDEDGNVVAMAGGENTGESQRAEMEGRPK